MTRPTSSRGRPSLFCSWGYMMQEVPEAAQRLWSLLTRFCGANASGTWWGPQSTMVKKLGIPLRTLQRRLKLLVDAGLVKVRRFVTDWGYRHMNIYTIPSLMRSVTPLGQPQDQNGASKVLAVSSKEEPILTDVQRPSDPHLWYESDVWFMARPSRAATTGQMAFDFGQTATDVVDRLDERTPACDTEDRCVSPKGAKGTAASRSVSYWLSGRTQRPPAGVIAGVAKAVKTCFEKNPALSEPAMRDVIDSLMKQGLDASPRQYLVAFGLQGRSRHVRKAGEDLWRHAPKKSSMTPERAAALSPATSTTRNGSSTATVATPPLAAWPAYESTTLASPPSSTTSPTPGETADLDAPPTEGLTFDFLNGYAPVAANTTRPARPAWAEQPWVEDPDAPPPANGDPRYASVVPPPEAGYGPHVRIDVLKPSGDANMGDILAGLFSNLGIDLTP